MLKLLAICIAVCMSWTTLAAEQQVTRVQASELRRTRIVNAYYPEFARKNGMEGQVVFNFTIMPDGSVADIEVAASDPVGIFEENATRALSQWRYLPVLRNGKAIRQPAMVTMKFRL